ncbi:MAG: four helix bundle protein [Bacteroidetes bacterium QS_8_64_10]|nr:MAG: four helix bundle protein [Bacteroidetes bacterium QS_8_64_10]
MTFDSWKESVPEAITADSLWKMKAYRLALFVSDVCWRDVKNIVQERTMRSLADQLYRSVGSVSVNIAEGYSRGMGKDRARFYEYALGSARESRDWYYKARFMLGEEVTEHRLSLMSEVIKLLLTMTPQQRGEQIREPAETYAANGEQLDLDALLESIPFPE